MLRFLFEVQILLCGCLDQDSDAVVPLATADQPDGAAAAQHGQPLVPALRPPTQRLVIPAVTQTGSSVAVTTAFRLFQLHTIVRLH